MNILNLLYPDRCPLCDTARPVKETGVCHECVNKLITVKGPVCEKCGRPIEKEGLICKDCETGNFSFDGGKSIYTYSSVSDSIYRLKYMNRAAYAKTYGKLMAREAADWLEWIKPDALVPVPLHKKRLIKRGYNQAKELADEISRQLGIPVADYLVKRSKNTVAQKLVDKKGRQLNMKKAFIVEENVVSFKRIVLIDDIFTTGSTIDSLSRVLKSAGVKEVFFLTISRAGV